MHHNFDRDFRGDTISPSVLQILDELDLADRLLQLRHTKIQTLTLQTVDGPVPVGDFRRLKTRFPYMTLLPQVHFLEFITAEAQRYPAFRLVMGAHVQELVEEAGVIRGVRYRARDGWHEVRALLTVEANRLPRWYRPGLLLIGDAAHVASPVGGAGINLAIHDAVVLSQTGCQCQLIALDRSLVVLQEDRVRIGRGE